MINQSNPAPTPTPAQNPGKRQRRMARSADPAAPAPAAVRQPGKLDLIEGLLRSADGASIAEMMTATGWQAHSVRGAMAGAIRKRGLVISSEKISEERRYRAGADQ